MSGVPETNEATDSGNVEVLRYDEQKSVRAFAELVCSEEFPPQMVEADHFREFMQMLNPLFKPSFNRVESECMKIYKERKVETKEIFGNFDGRISLSVDMLRYENYDTLFCEDYLCLSAHFIDENWKMKTWVLYFRPLSVLSSSDDLHHEDEDWGIFRSLKDWGIENKICTLTTMTKDYCYDELVEFVKTHIQEKKKVQLGGQLFRVYCCGEIMSLMVQGAFDKIEDIIDKVRELYSFGRSLPLWYLTSSKLKQALELWSMGEFSSKDVTDFYDVPSPDEWKKVEGVCKIVDNIYDVSKALFETKHLTANVYLYHLHELREILTQMSTDNDSFVRKIVEGMLKRFDKYWDDMFLLLAIAAALDPRFKMKYIEFVCSKVKGKDANSKAAAVLEVVHNLFDEYVVSSPEKNNFMSDSSSSDSDLEGESLPPRNVNHTFLVLQDYQQFIQLSNQPTKKSDLDYYLEEPVIPWSQDFNALTWWRFAGAKYPTLSRIARDILAIPVSVASSFEAFYTAPRPADPRLVCLKPDLMKALMCTRSWCRKH